MSVIVISDNGNQLHHHPDIIITRLSKVMHTLMHTPKYRQMYRQMHTLMDMQMDTQM